MKYLSLSLAIVTLILGIGIGYTLTPQYTLASETMTNTFGRADRFVDLRYINKMIAHHRETLLMAEQVKDMTQREEIRNLAHSIINTEPKAIDELYEWKRAWYRDSSKVEDPMVTKFGSYDETFDLRYLNAMISHHLDGIDMAKDIITKSSRTEILRNADPIRTSLVSTIAALRDWRSQWYGIN